MSYIATLASCMLGDLYPLHQYITPQGSSHGANKYFPIELYQKTYENHRPIKLQLKDWIEWYQQILYQNMDKDLCIIKDSWYKLGRENWEICVNSTQSLAVVSTCDQELDWFYCWFNMVNKIPKHIYYSLSERSLLYPRLWNKLNKAKKITEMIKAMPIYTMGNSPIFSVPSLSIPASDIVNLSFPKLLSDFLEAQDLHVKLTTEIIEFHKIFAEKQEKNLEKAQAIIRGQRWKSSGPFDDILFAWLDSHEPKDIWP